MKSSWPWILTIFAIAAAIFVFVFAPDMNTRSQLGDYLGGFASAIAFIWLIAAYVQQGNELRLQREELSMQRTSLDLQREELSKLGRFAALEQVSQILDQFDQSFQKMPNGLVRTANDLPRAFTEGMKEWKTILNNQDAGVVFDAHVRWMNIHNPCLEFLERIVSAIELYSKNSGELLLQPGNSSAERIIAGYERIKDIPYIRHFIGSAYGLAMDMVLLQPGIDRVRLKGYEAMEKVMPGVVKTEALAELSEKVAAHDRAQNAAKDTTQT